jgi:hypothetical protein
LKPQVVSRQVQVQRSSLECLFQAFLQRDL